MRIYFLTVLKGAKLTSEDRKLIRKLILHRFLQEKPKFESINRNFLTHEETFEIEKCENVKKIFVTW